MNEIGWFVAGIEFVLLGIGVSVTIAAARWMERATQKITEAARRIELDSREIDNLMRQRNEHSETIEELEENAVMLYEAAGLEGDAKFMDAVRLIRKYRQDSLEYATFKERASKIFVSEPGA